MIWCLCNTVRISSNKDSSFVPFVQRHQQHPRCRPWIAPWTFLCPHDLLVDFAKRGSERSSNLSTASCHRFFGVLQAPPQRHHGTY